jgi:hypothetical protein
MSVVGTLVVPRNVCSWGNSRHISGASLGPLLTDAVEKVAADKL